MIVIKRFLSVNGMYENLSYVRLEYAFPYTKCSETCSFKNLNYNVLVTLISL